MRDFSGYFKHHVTDSFANSNYTSACFYLQYSSRSANISRAVRSREKIEYDYRARLEICEKLAKHNPPAVQHLSANKIQEEKQ
jgi:hypothetical protein